MELLWVYSPTKMLVRNIETIRQHMKSEHFLPLMAHMAVKDIS